MIFLHPLKKDTFRQKSRPLPAASLSSARRSICPIFFSDGIRTLQSRREAGVLRTGCFSHWSVFDPTFQVPFHHQQIFDAAPETVPHAILGATRDPRPVPHRHPDGFGSGGQSQDRQKAMEPVKWQYRLEDRSLESAKIA